MEFHHFHQKIYQTGDGFDLPIFRGVKTVQRGQGIGAFLSRIFKFALPIVKKHIIPQATKGLISTVGQVVSQPTLNRKKVKQIIHSNTKETGKQILLSALNNKKKKKRKQKGQGK